MESVRLPLAAVTDTGGDGASDLKSVPGGATIEAIDFFVGTLTVGTGTSITITDEINGESITILSVTNPSLIRYFPRTLEHLNTDGTNLATHTKPIVAGFLKLAVAGGGAGENCEAVVHFEE